MTGRHHRRRQRGLGAIAVVVVLVVLAGLAAAVVRLGATAQATAAQELLAARAAMAARAGLQWGLWQAFKGAWADCDGASQTLDLGAEGGLRVTVGCSHRAYREGESAPGVPRTVRVYTLEAVACNGAAACPDAAAAARPGYVERRWQVHASD